MSNPSPESSWLVIRPSTRWWRIDCAEYWRHRELFAFLIWRNIKVRYKQTVMGLAWALVQPLLAAAVFTVIFGLIVKDNHVDGVPRFLFNYSGMVMWTYFAGALTFASGSLMSDANLVRRIYFPRLILPTTACLTGWFDFLISFAVLVCVMPLYHAAPLADLVETARYWPSLGILLMPCFLLLATVAALSVSLWLSALGIQYHDVRYAVPFFIQMWFFVSPIVYSPNVVPAECLWLYGLNPMASVITGFRWSLGMGSAPDTAMVLVSVGTTLVLLVLGLRYFRNTESIFADVI